MQKRDKIISQVVSLNDITETPTPPKLNLFNRNIRYLKIKDVKRAYSKLIQDYCKGLVNNEDAKTVTYMFSSYLQLIRDFEFEDRLNEIEKRIQNNK